MAPETLIDRSYKNRDRGQRGADVRRIAYPPSKLRMVRREKVIVIFYCADWRELPEGASRPGNILKQIKPRLTPHYFRHNYVTLLYESGVDPLIAMKIVGHTDYQTTANIYTHVRDEMLKKATVNMNEVFQQRTEEYVRQSSPHTPMRQCIAVIKQQAEDVMLLPAFARYGLLVV